MHTNQITYVKKYAFIQFKDSSHPISLHFTLYPISVMINIPGLYHYIPIPGITTELQLHWLYFELLQCHDFRLVRTDVAEYEDELKPGSKVKVYEVLWVKKQ